MHSWPAAPLAQEGAKLTAGSGQLCVLLPSMEPCVLGALEGFPGGVLKSSAWLPLPLGPHSLGTGPLQFLLRPL